MGMYTKINVRLKLKKELPDDVIYALSLFNNESTYHYDENLIPKHDLFKKPRWHLVLQSGCLNNSYLISRSELKNYDGEIESFFDWIKQHVESCQDGVMGDSIYEEDDEPTFYYKS